MKKLILFVAIILFGCNVIPQRKTYLLFEFMKVDSKRESNYLDMESFWEKIHDQCVKSGEIMGWQLWRLQQERKDQGYQYVTVQVFNDPIKMFQDADGKSFLTIAKRAFPTISDADLLTKGTESLKSRDLADTF
ncbi:hypothetical protein ACEN2I_15930 [Flavobacterium sp. W22_SRS_FK3]|uniref:hypothetical protein n=1 Tax=Flavobacterium sp. W22_SRS_FK3 TaxID=3240275 RepID=UPI003F8F6DED